MDLEKEIEKEIEEEDLEGNFIFSDHDYESEKGWCWNQYNTEIVSYIAGYIAKSIMKKITCDICIESLTTQTKPSLLQKRKCRGGLLSPNTDLICVCKVAERVLRNSPNIFTLKNVLARLILKAKNALLRDIFLNINHMFDQSPLADHRDQLIDAILKRYFSVRMHHEGAARQQNINRIRAYHNKLVLFTNQ
ncbi:unnamed protein product [Lasius platythorax]|uniref:Uncharacterized protein n=1 Tax=Lasius platythorax TaxID=488582 RepID=A0AAV2MZB7_9HYME